MTILNCHKRIKYTKRAVKQGKVNKKSTFPSTIDPEINQLFITENPISHSCHSSYCSYSISTKSDNKFCLFTKTHQELYFASCLFFSDNITSDKSSQSTQLDSSELDIDHVCSVREV